MTPDIVQTGPPTVARTAYRARPRPGPAAAPPAAGTADRADAISALYQAHALGLIRLAHVMLGDAAAAEDVVQEAFCGLYRRWGGLADHGKALQYVRSAVLNRCRSVLRQRLRHGQAGAWPDALTTMSSAPSAETAALDGETARALLAAVQRLPHRQREAVVLRYYLDMPEAEIAAVMDISPGSVRSATSRALGTLGQKLENLR
jgi:RNA polymerase sigma-70 factor (sigma-E family)